jgi:hemoglobin-like flavoprotein
MNKEQAELVRNSLVHIRPIADEIAESFYAHLFDVTPKLRKLFTGDMKRQGEMLMTSLELAVSSLDNPKSILSSVQALGERHASYGVKVEYYQLAKEAYLWSLENHLGDEFTPELQDAWATAFGALVEAMISAAQR